MLAAVNRTTVHNAARIAANLAVELVVDAVTGGSGVARTVGIAAGVDVDGPSMVSVLLAELVGTTVTVGAILAVDAGELLDEDVALLDQGRDDGLRHHGTHGAQRSKKHNDFFHNNVCYLLFINVFIVSISFSAGLSNGRISPSCTSKKSP